MNVYRGVQNIVVKLSNINDSYPEAENYMLLNSHFDTVPMSPGAGDDGTMTGVMLELLRVFAQQEPLKHPVVFLFNGLEESGLQGSHAFIHNSKWMDNIKYVPNLSN